MRRSLLLLLAVIPPVVTAQDAMADLRSKVPGLFGSFQGSFTYTSSGGSVTSGQIYYQYPNKAHLKFAGGGVVATNGQYLWIYSPASGYCIRQDAGGSSGGVLGIAGGYTGTIRGSSYIFKGSGYFDEIAVTVSGSMLRSVRFRRDDEISTITFSGIQTGVGIKATLFNFRPPVSAQYVENPLNN